MASTEDRVRQIIADVFGVPPEKVTAQTTNNEVEAWDSLGVLNLMMTIEQEFGISLSPEEAGQLTSVAGVVAVVQSKQ